MDDGRTLRFVRGAWSASIVPTLCEYVRIPNQSPGFDPQWQENGHMDAAVDLVAGWAKEQALHGLQMEVVRLPGRTPLLLLEVGQGERTVLLYGHLDKQPPMHGWEAGLGPWTPVLRDGRLYGRGAADDGYAAFAAVTAIKALQEQQLPHARCVILIEASEESGSGDLPAYVEALAGRIGKPELVICLDSGCGDYDRLWVTASLRGLLNGTLRVRVLREGVHSGAAGGIVPSSFRIARQLLSRLEDESSGALCLEALHVNIPDERCRQAAAAAEVLGAGVAGAYPFAGSTQSMTPDTVELLLNRAWRPQLEITGAAGLPSLEEAGNVLRPETALKLSLRLPPTADAKRAAMAVKTLLESDPPYGAQVQFDCREAASGWNAPPFEPWLERASQEASQAFFGQPPCFMGEGGTIPFMAMLGRRFPEAQFLITGVLGPHSNAHGPNEFLDIATGERLTACIAHILHCHYQSL
jgi:acetylornithine deacetylase/succinyl-diaminopimelate desuccinylase-like protein